MSCDKFSVRYRNFLAALTVEREPIHDSKAMKDGRWWDAMHCEIKALEAMRLG